LIFEAHTLLNPFSGSGTTLKMAQAHKRCFIGIEINETYVDIIQKRLNFERDALVIETDNYISRPVQDEVVSDASSSTSHQDKSE